MSGSVGVRSSVRPVGGALVSAGPDGGRLPSPYQSIEVKAPTASRLFPACGRVQIVIIIPCAPLQFGAAAVSRRDLDQAMTGGR